MTETEVEKFFTRADGSYLFARWGRPIVPVVFGVDDRTLSIVKGAIDAVVALADHRMADTDPELGANLVMFFFREWSELLETPDLDRLVPELEGLVGRLTEADANQYRLFRFDPDGAIKAAFVFVRMDAALSSMAAEDLALAQAAESIVLWSDTAFREKGPLGRAGDRVVLRPDVAAVIRSAYDPVMPAMATDPSHAIRLAARVGQMQ
ncbi:hypothetical protein GQ651_12715 [Alphaproteobacteria bacterium GH1-50]|uniref:Uncharacterized protein n=1 Tax=Kangsaoukella pontilimi TaxID=2691042 RepID=A0A7C9ME55_9RHOB|nr:hypothetical protein [Kangsaoukella pontilimi]MXQ08711.1 hypothetical protein [Kangsaoukella pontilimi]